jgi:hypothetical protein
MRERSFLKAATLIVFGGGLVGLALKFTTFFDEWYWLPWWPNVGDAAFIAVAGIVLLFLGFQRGYEGK